MHNSGGILFIDVINLTKGQTQNVYLTLWEKKTLSNPNYLFRFIQRTTNDEVRFVVLTTSDTSTAKDRYNRFSFVVNTLFPSAVVGEYHYFIYEQASTSNTNPSAAGKMIESGIMRLNEAANNVYAFEAYQTDNEYITR